MICKNRAFTLVELIVVITIISILSTMWFVAYTDYLRWVRDSNRIQQITEIHKAILLYWTRSSLPLPDDSVSVVAWLAGVWTQGYASQQILDTIKYSDGWVDPKTKDYFTYFVSSDRKYAQLLGFFEEDQSRWFSSVFSNAYADYDSLYPKVYGANLWMLLQETTQIPLQELSIEHLDILSTTDNYLSYISNTNVLKWNGYDLFGMVPNTDCKKISETFPLLESGIHKINPSWTEQIEVYCDMEFEWWGWTLVARSVLWQLGDTSFWWNVNRWSVYDDSQPYSMGTSVKNIVFNEFMWTRYSTWKEFVLPARKMLVDRTPLVSDSQASSLFLPWCVSTVNLICIDMKWGNVVKTDNYFFTQASNSDWFAHRWLWYQSFIYNNADEYNAEPGMIFVR